jgi:hypothetical protein
MASFSGLAGTVFPDGGDDIEVVQVEHDAQRSRLPTQQECRRQREAVAPLEIGGPFGGNQCVVLVERGLRDRGEVSFGETDRREELPTLRQALDQRGPGAGVVPFGSALRKTSTNWWSLVRLRASRP